MKKCPIIFLLLLCFGLCPELSTAQTWKELDSLSHELQYKRYYSDAAEYAEDALQSAAKELGKTDTVYAYLLNRAMEVNTLSGNNKEAVKYGNAELSLRENTLKQSKKKLVDCKIDLALAYTGAEDFTNAKKIIDDLLLFAATEEGESSLLYAQVCIGTGRVYLRNKDYENAETWLQKAKSIFEKQSVLNSGSYAQALLFMARVYIDSRNEEKYDTAEMLLLNSILITEKNFGAYSFQYKTNVDVLYDFYYYKYSRAPTRIYYDWKKLIASSPQNALGLKLTLIEEYFSYEVTKYDDYFEPILQEIYDSLSKTETKNPEQYALLCYLLCKVYTYQGDFEKAFAYCSEGLEVLEEISKRVIPSYASDFYKLATILYHGQGNFSTAIQSYLNSNNVFLKQFDFSFDDLSCKFSMNLCSDLKAYFKQFTYDNAVFYYKLIEADKLLEYARYNSSQKINYLKGALDNYESSCNLLKKNLKYYKTDTVFLNPDIIYDKYNRIIIGIFDSLEWCYKQENDTLNLLVNSKNRAGYYTENNQYDEAAAIYLSLADHYNKAGDSGAEASIYRSLYEVECYAGDTMKANTYLLAAAGLYYEAEDYNRAIKSYITLAQTEKASDPEKAFKFLLRAEMAADKMPEDLYGVSYTYINIAKVCKDLGKNKYAVLLSKKTGINIVDYHASFYSRSFGDLLDDENKFVDGAKDQLFREIFPEAVSSSDSASFLMLLALAIIDSDINENAMPLFNDAIAMYRRGNDLIGEKVAYDVMNYLYMETNALNSYTNSYNADIKTWLPRYEKFVSGIYDESKELYNAKNYEQACDTLLYLSACARIAGDEPTYVQLLINIADILYETNKNEKAKILLNKTLSIIENSDEQDFLEEEYADVCLALAQIYYDEDRYYEAAEWADEALNYAYYTITKSFANLMLSLCYTETEPEEPDLAFSYAQTALTGAKKSKEPVAIHDACTQLIRLYMFSIYQMPDYSAAGKYLHKCEKLKLPATENYRLMEESYLRAQYLFRTGKPEAALREVEDLESNLTSYPNFYYGDVFSLHGTILKLIGHLPEALTYFEKAIQFEKQHNGKELSSVSYNHIGWIYERYGEPDKALEYHEKALALQREKNEYDDMAYSLLNIAGIYKDQGDAEMALRRMHEALEIAESRDLFYPLANAYQSLGNYALSENNDADAALDYLENAYYYASEMDDRVSLSWTYSYMGKAYLNKGDYENAIIYYNKSIKTSSKTGVFYGNYDAKLGLAQSYLNMQDVSNAKKYANEAYTEAAKKNEPTALYDCLKMLNKIAVYEKNWNAADSYIPQILQHQNKLMMSNFATMAEEEQANYFNTLSGDFMNFYSYCLFRNLQNPGLSAMAYDNIMKHKGILLKSSTSMRNAVYNSGDRQLIENYKNWILTKNMIADKYAAGEEASQLEQQANEIEKELVKSSQLFSDFNKIQDYSWKDVQKNLKHDEVAIEFIHFNWHNFDAAIVDNATDSVIYCALIVDKNCQQPLLLPMFSEDELQRILLALGSETNFLIIDALYGSNRGVTFVDSAYRNVDYSEQLYSLLWQPLEKYLQGIKTVYYAPDGMLHSIAFSALPYNDSLFLCDKYTLHYCASTASLAYETRSSFRKPAGNEIWAYLYGGINFDMQFDESQQSNIDSTVVNRNKNRSVYIPSNSRGESWTYLPGTLEEIEQIGKIFDENTFPYQIITADNGTEDIFKAQSSSNPVQVIHIATHGFYFPQTAYGTMEQGLRFSVSKNPMVRSGLIMAGGNTTWSGFPPYSGKGDGILTAFEVSCLDLNKTSLVVLSACETGLGDVKGSEGVYGLQRAFKMAGADYLIMSLWKVADTETAEFMTLLYQNLTQTLDVNQAFVNTQQEMRKKYPPYYWAAFVLVE
ncbi:MAG TPA: CHAT domain-containing protein [Bacteroidales bacterium]|nr:CHAT domain-containing protein [Bacteroidales bacterium]